jgi:glycosyltransferase involved in cell wall biosynthesis
MRAPILHVIPHLWSGAGAVVTRLCEAQRRAGPVTLVTAGQGGELGDWPAYRRRLRRAGVAHHTIDFFHRDAPTFWTGVEALARLLRSEQPAVVHAHAGVPAAAGAIARAIAGQRPPLVAQMYSWGLDRPEWMNVQDVWGFGQVDRVVCSARAYWRLLVDRGIPERRLVYLPWGLPLDELPYTRQRLHRPDAGPVLGFVGRIEPRKGQLDLVETLARVRRRAPAARLELVGPVADAAYATRVRAAIRRHRLEAAVTLFDRVPSVVPFLRRWNVFVSLSSDEGQGLAVLEAMAVGVPVVARRVAGIEDFLEPDCTGVAVPHSGVASAARAVTRVLEDAALRATVIGRARRLVERRYDWSRMLLAFDRLYGGRR